MKTIRTIALLSLPLTLGACRTYTDHTSAMRTAVYEENYPLALQKLEQSSAATASNDKVVFLLERGYIHYRSKNYSAAANDFDDAYRQMQFLFSKSVSRNAASLITNDSTLDYEGESHEKVLNSIYTAFALWAKGDMTNAASMGRRANETLEAINQKNEGKSVYSRDAFGYFIAGLMMEYRSEWDNARIEYQRALEAAEANLKWARRMNVRPIVESLGRLLEYRGQTNAVNALRAKYPSITWMKHSEFQNYSEVIAVFEAGKAPLKVSDDMWHENNGQQLKIAMPRYVTQPYAISTAKVYVNNAYVGSPVVLQDVGASAFQSLEDAKWKNIARGLARVLGKTAVAAGAGAAGKAIGGKEAGTLLGFAGGVFGAATEVADTRNWSTLPDTIQILRIPVKPGQVTVRLAPDGDRPVEQTFNLRRGDKALIQTRSFR